MLEQSAVLEGISTARSHFSSSASSLHFHQQTHNNNQKQEQTISTKSTAKSITSKTAVRIFHYSSHFGKNQTMSPSLHTTRAQKRVLYATGRSATSAFALSTSFSRAPSQDSSLPCTPLHRLLHTIMAGAHLALRTSIAFPSPAQENGLLLERGCLVLLPFSSTHAPFASTTSTRYPSLRSTRTIFASSPSSCASSIFQAHMLLSHCQPAPAPLRLCLENTPRLQPQLFRIFPSPIAHAASTIFPSSTVLCLRSWRTTISLSPSYCTFSFLQSLMPQAHSLPEPQTNIIHRQCRANAHLAASCHVSGRRSTKSE